VGVLPGFSARNEIPGGQNLAVIPSRSEILGSQNRFDENDIYISVNKLIKLPDADRTMSYIAVPGIVNKIVFSLGRVLKLNYPLYGTVST